MTFGQRVRMYRKIKGLTQTELALKVGYSEKSAISKLENDNFDVPQSKIMEIAQALGVSPADLFFDDTNKLKSYDLMEDINRLDNEDIETVRSMVLVLLKKDKYKRSPV